MPLELAEARTKETIGQNMRAARELAGKSQEQFAEALGISRATLSAIENGKVTVDSAKLVTASKLLGVPVTEFFREGEERIALLYRAAEDVVPTARVRSRFQQFCDAYRQLEDIVGVADTLLPPPEYSYYPDSHSKALLFASQVAVSERERLGLGHFDPIENVFQLLEEKGVRILACDIDQEGVFGISGFSRHYGPCILVNSRNTVERNIFTVVHEYGHLLIHRNWYLNRDPTDASPKNDQLEQMAHIFAGTFLVPEAGLKDVFVKNVKGATSLEDVLFLKRQFRVSALVILHRLKQTNLISPQDFERLSDALREKQPDATKEFAPLRQNILAEWKCVSRFEHLARKATLQEMVSIGRLAELLGENIVETRRRAQEWRKDIAIAPA